MSCVTAPAVPIGSSSTAVQGGDGLPPDDISGPIAADGNSLLVAGRASAAWIIDFDPLFADGFEP